MRRCVISPSRTCRSHRSGGRGAVRRFAAAWRSAMRSLDLAALSALGVLDGLAAQAAAACSQTSLNAFMAMGHAASAALRAALSAALRAGSVHEARLRTALVAQDAAEYRVAARRRATTRTSTPRFTTPPPSGGCFVPTTRCCPISSGCPSVITAGLLPSAYRDLISRDRSGRCCCRGRRRRNLRPTRRLDYELEVGVFIGRGNALGSSGAARASRTARVRAVSAE